MTMTTRAQFTPGPWYVENDAAGLANNIRCNPQPSDTGSYIAMMESSVGIETTHANARLIAAAPDLAAALEGIVAFVEAWAGYLQNPAVKRETAARAFTMQAQHSRAALAKAGVA